MRADEGIPVAPITLTAQQGSSPKRATCARPPGESSDIRVVVVASKAGLFDFTIDVDRATMPTLPSCPAGPTPAAHLATSFTLGGASDPALVLSVLAAQDWRCKGTHLQTP